jgi:hypothetical protein
MYKAGAQKTHVNSFMVAGLSSPPSFFCSQTPPPPRSALNITVFAHLPGVLQGITGTTRWQA